MKYTLVEKAKALAAFMRVPVIMVEAEPKSVERFFVSDSEFYVLTDEEATLRATHLVANSLDALPAADILKYTFRGATLGDIEALQEKHDIRGIFQIMRDFKGFCEELFEERSRAYFLAEDRVEIDEGAFFIYRLN